jgi:hypothetical protein
MLVVIQNTSLLAIPSGIAAGGCRPVLGKANVLKRFCGRRDLNPYGLSATSS